MFFLKVRFWGGDVARIIAAPEEQPAYRLERARHLAPYVRELLDRARTDTGLGQTALVKLERKEDVVSARVCWDTDALASVWVSEVMEVYCEDPVQLLGWTETDMSDSTIARVERVIASLEEELHSMFEKDRFGKDSNGRQYVFCAPGGLIAALDLPSKQVGKITAVPEAERSRRAVMGQPWFPMRVDGRHRFAVRFTSSMNWTAQSKVASVLEAFICAGAAGTRGEQ